MVAFTRRGKDIEAVEQQYRALLRSERYYTDTARFQLSVYRFVERFRKIYDEEKNSLIDLDRKSIAKSFNDHVFSLFENIKYTLNQYAKHANENDPKILGEVLGNLTAGISYRLTSDLIDGGNIIKLESLPEVIIKLRDDHPNTDFSIIQARILQIGQKKAKQVRKGKAKGKIDFVALANFFNR